MASARIISLLTADAATKRGTLDHRKTSVDVMTNATAAYARYVEHLEHLDDTDLDEDEHRDRCDERYFHAWRWRNIARAVCPEEVARIESQGAEPHVWSLQHRLENGYMLEFMRSYEREMAALVGAA